jgi:HEPN domain-containing protein
MKQTAIEWLIEQMFEQGYFDGNKPLTFTNLDHLQQQAKEMEKEQIISVYWDAYNEGKYSTDKTAEEYYNETFKQD